MLTVSIDQFSKGESSKIGKEFFPSEEYRKRKALRRKMSSKQNKQLVIHCLLKYKKTLLSK